MLTKNLIQKMNHRNNLIAEYASEVEKMQGKIAQLQMEIDAAVAASDFKKAALLEREIVKSHEEIEAVERAGELAKEKMRITIENVRQEWKGIEADYIKKIDKAQEKADKAFATFSTALDELTAILNEVHSESSQYIKLAITENPDMDSNLKFRPDMLILQMTIDQKSKDSLFKEYGYKI